MIAVTSYRALGAPITLERRVISPRFGEETPTPPLVEPHPVQKPKRFFMLTDGRTGWQQAKAAFKKTMFVVALGWSTIWGGGHGYNLTVGDGKLPTINNIAVSHAREVRANTTMKFYQQAPTASQAEWWKALEPTREVLKALSPEVHEWFTNMYAGGNVKFFSHNKDKGSKEDSLAYFDVVARKMYIDTPFLANNDGEKASIIMHEYRHSRQNAGKMIADLVSPKRIATTNAEILANELGHRVAPGTWSYGSVIEDEAHLYENEALQKMGLDSYSEYLVDRGFQLTHNH